MQISVDAYPENGALGFQLSSAKMTIATPPSGENGKDQTGGSSSSAEVLSVNTEVGHFCGKDHSSQANHKCGFSIPLVTSNTDKQFHLASPVDSGDTTSLSSGGSPDSGDNGRVSMVGSRGISAQSNTIGN